MGGCVWCLNASTSEFFQTKFNELVCTACRKTRPEYGLISKSNAKNKYLVTDSDIRSLRFVEKPNPTNAKFRDMKLFLIKQIIECALRRYGSLENVEEEKRKREVERFMSRQGSKRSKRPTAEQIATGEASAKDWSKRQAAVHRRSSAAKSD